MRKEKLLKNEGLLHVVAAGLALALAFFVQYGLGKFPCHLCILQRYPYAVAAVLGLLFFISRKHLKLAPLFRLLLLAAYLTTAGIAMYHVAVEQDWIAGPSGCSAQTGTAATVEEMRRQLMSATLVSCKDAAANLFGISMAAWNALYALSLAVGTGYLWKMSKKL